MAGPPRGHERPLRPGQKDERRQAQVYRRQYNFNAVVLVPGNVYGPHDNFDPATAHVVAALVRKFYEAKRDGHDECVLWGSGRPARHFIYVQDVCEAILLAARTYDGGDIINVSSGVPTSIKELAETLAELVGYTGRIRWDTFKPDGQMRKVFDVKRMRQRLDFSAAAPLREGLVRTIDWFASTAGLPTSVGEKQGVCR